MVRFSIGDMGKAVFESAKIMVRKAGEEISRQIDALVQTETKKRNDKSRTGKRAEISNMFKGETRVQISETEVAIRSSIERVGDTETSKVKLYSVDPKSKFTSEVTFYKRPREQEKKLMTVKKTCSTNKFQMVSTEFKLEDTWGMTQEEKKKIVIDKPEEEETEKEVGVRIVHNLDMDKVIRVVIQSFVENLKRGMGLG